MNEKTEYPAGASSFRGIAEESQASWALDSGYRETVLENGIRVVTETMPVVRSVSLGVLVDTGPRDDPAGREGLAHLVEHLMFQGTASRDALEIARWMDGAGGQVGGFTAKDYTCYYATVFEDYLTYALDLLGDILLNSIYPETRVEREKSAILCEIEAAGDQPRLRVDQLLKERVWPDHPLGCSAAGSLESVARLNREDIIYFVHQHYLPDRIVIAAAGQVEHEDFVAQVRDAFWRLQGTSEIVRPTPRVASGGVVVEHRDLAQAYFALGLPIPAHADESRYLLHYLNKILGSGISSRLFRRLREEAGWVYGVDSEVQAYRDAGLWVIEGSTTPACLLPVVQAILEELQALLLAEREVDDEELVRARRQLGSMHWIGGEDTHTRMSRLAVQEFYFGRPLAVQEIVGSIEAVSSQDLHRLGPQLYRRGAEGLSLAVISPKSEDREISKAELESLLDSYRQPASSSGLEESELPEGQVH